MINFKSISLEDKILFDKYLKPYRFLTCEYTFTNLFIWRKGCHIQYAIVDDALVIKKTGFDNSDYFMQPIGYTKSSLPGIIDKLSIYKTEYNMNYLFMDAESPFITELEDMFPGKYEIKEDRNNFDYIYETKNLINLSGRKYHGQRNHYNCFRNNYNYQVTPITEDVVDDCIFAAREWCCKNGCRDYLLYELHAIEEILNYESELNFYHMAVYVEGKLSAFTIGEKVNSDVGIIHIEKADNSISGLYNFVNKTFLETKFSDVPYINREQDLGIDGLRRAKLSYHPFKLEPKYCIR